MNLTTKKCSKFEELKQVIAAGIIFAGGIGLIWAALYWSSDLKALGYIQ
jgi:hypothetical protein